MEIFILALVEVISMEGVMDKALVRASPAVEGPQAVIQRYLAPDG
jgi:hypothetical protein